MTQEELLQAINAAGLTANQLAMVLQYAAALVEREALKSAMAKVRTEQTAASLKAEQELQALQAQIDAIDAALAAQQPG